MRFVTASFLAFFVLVAATTALPSLEGASDVVQQYESLMDRLYTTIMVAVLLVATLSLSYSTTRGTSWTR